MPATKSERMNGNGMKLLCFRRQTLRFTSLARGSGRLFLPLEYLYGLHRPHDCHVTSRSLFQSLATSVAIHLTAACPMSSPAAQIR